MLAIDDLPPLRTGSTIALIGLVLVLWLWVRVQIIQRQQLRGASLDDLPRTPPWLQRLAAWPPIRGVLRLAAFALSLLLAWSIWG